jgi:hypothetical protein
MGFVCHDRDRASLLKLSSARVTRHQSEKGRKVRSIPLVRNTAACSLCVRSKPIRFLPGKTPTHGPSVLEATSERRH